ncbi:MAG: four helix bundle protein [Pyrinomonadaceae bacterium]
MKYKRFEELPVWKDSIEFAVNVFDLGEMARADFQGLGDLKNQLERAAVSVSSNIAEGFERGTTTELIHFLYISRGSSGECRSITHILGKLPRFSKFKEKILDLRNRSERINKQLYGWINSLKNTEIKGEKFLTEQTRKAYLERQDLIEFNNEMAEWRREFNEKLKRQEAENYAERMREE